MKKALRLLCLVALMTVAGRAAAAEPLTVLNKDKSATLATLAATADAGRYQGFMYAAAWLNCWFQETDGTVWGNSDTAGAFKLSKESSAWNCWFAGTGSGDWLVTVNLNSQEWSCAYVSSVTVNGSDMTYEAASKAWKVVITTTSDNTNLAFSATAKKSDATTGDQTSTDISIDSYLPIGGTIAKAGTYTVTLAIGEDGSYQCTTDEGDNTSDGKAPIPTALKVYDKEGANVLATLQPTGTEGVFSGQLTSTEAWMNFQVVDEENNIWYGTDPGDKTTVTSIDGKYNFWIDSEQTGVYDLEVNLVTMKWTATYNESATGLKTIQTIDNGQLIIDNAVYDLQGRRVACPTRGLYIVGGKKIIVK